MYCRVTHAYVRIRPSGGEVVKRISRTLAVGMSSLLLAGGAAFVAAPAAQASESVDMNLACQITMGTDSWRAYLYDSSNVYGWRCRNGAFPYQSGYGASVQSFCSVIYGLNAHYSNYYNPYSWYCS